MAHQSLYRRYRSQRFGDLVGQEPVVRALLNAVAGGTHGHAYLFSGPRGTGKTSTARILAKALNCTNLADGEPCGECESCKAIEQGKSFDVVELDAASNNGVDAMRDLITATFVSSPGRTKVYILDEVQMLSTSASNALLKSLEEPPEHVVFVLATTDPHKVLPTIRSRTQHFEFSLLTASELTEHVRWIVGDAGLSVDEASIAHVVRQGRGSARDTLSALDMVVASGGVTERVEPIDDIVAAIVERDVGRVLAAVAAWVAQGSEPRVLGESLLTTLRDAFLAVVGAELGHLSADDQTRFVALGKQLGTPRITRSLEALGAALIDMRQAADPRIPLEVALIRLCDPSLDESPAALLERIERLERAMSKGGAPVAAAPAATAPSPAAPPPAAPSPATRSAVEPSDAGPAVPGPDDATSAAGVRAQLAKQRGDAPAPSAAGPAESAPSAAPAPPPRTPRGMATPAPAPAPAAPAAAAPETPAPSAPEVTAPVASGHAPSIEQLQAALTDSVLSTLRPVARAIYSGGHFVDGTDDRPVFAIVAAPMDRAESSRSDVEAGLSAHFGRPIAMTLTGGPSAGARAAQAPMAAEPVRDDGDEDDDPHVGEVHELDDAIDVTVTGVDKLAEAFPGAVLIEQEPK